MTAFFEFSTALPFVLGLYQWLVVEWALRFAVRDRAVRLVRHLNVIELAFVCGGERRALATAAGALELSGESPDGADGRLCAENLEDGFISLGLLQRARVRQAIHLVLALLPLAGLFATPGLDGSEARLMVLIGSMLVGLSTFFLRLLHRRNDGWELSPLGREVSFRFRARHGGLEFHEWLLARLRPGPALPICVIVFGFMLLIGPLRSATVTSAPEQPPAPLARADTEPKSAPAPATVMACVAPNYVLLGSADRDPEVEHEVVIAYPEGARREGIEGTVRLRIVVDNEGRVVDVKVVSGPGHGLNDAASDALRKFKFKPAIKRGEPVSTSLVYNYTFRLNSPKAGLSELRKQPPDFVVHVLWPLDRVGDFGTEQFPIASSQAKRGLSD